MAQSKPGFVDELPNYVRTACVIATDFEKLFTKFTSSKSVRYEWFLQIWKEMKMSLFFSGRQNDRECREFTEDCLKIASAYCLPPYQFQVRVCGLYLLYALYFRHPFEPRVKIRVTLPEWKELMSFLSEIHQQQHLDVEYIFCRLRQDRAFHFVAVKTELYPGVRGVGDVLADAQQQKVDMIVEQSSAISNIFQPDAIDELSTIHEEYHRHKCALAGLNATQPDPSFNIINASLVHDITKAVTAHENWRKNKGGKKLSGRRRRETPSGQTTSESEGESEPDLQPVSSSSTTKATKSVGAVRAEIKARAFSTVGIAAQSRRHRQAIVINSDEAPPVTVPRKRGQRRHSSGGNRSMPADYTANDEEDANDANQFFGFLNLQPDPSGILSMPNLLGEETPIKKEDQVKSEKATTSGRRKRASKDQSAEVKKSVKRKQVTEATSSNKTPKSSKTASGEVKKRGRPKKDFTPTAPTKEEVEEMPETEGKNEGDIGSVPKNVKKRLSLAANEGAKTTSVPKSSEKKCLSFDGDEKGDKTTSVPKSSKKKRLSLDGDEKGDKTSSVPKSSKKKSLILVTDEKPTVSVPKDSETILILDADEEAPKTSSVLKSSKKCLKSAKNSKKSLILNADEEPTASVPKDSEKSLILEADEEAPKTSSVLKSSKKCLTSAKNSKKTLIIDGDEKGDKTTSVPKSSKKKCLSFDGDEKGDKTTSVPKSSKKKCLSFDGDEKGDKTSSVPKSSKKKCLSFDGDEKGDKTTSVPKSSKKKCLSFDGDEKGDKTSSVPKSSKKKCLSFDGGEKGDKTTSVPKSSKKKCLSFDGDEKGDKTTSVPKSSKKKCLSFDGDEKGDKTISVPKSSKKKCLSFDGDEKGDKTSSVPKSSRKHVKSAKNSEKCLILDTDEEPTACVPKDSDKSLNLVTDEEGDKTSSVPKSSKKKCLSLGGDEKGDKTSSVPKSSRKRVKSAKNSEKCLILDTDEEPTASVLNECKKTLILDADEEPTTSVLKDSEKCFILVADDKGVTAPSSPKSLEKCLVINADEEIIVIKDDTMET